MSKLSYDNFADLPRQPKVGGAILVDGVQKSDTYRCVHCSAAWYPKPGSGKTRGYCNSCKGLVCGQPKCMEVCIPLEMTLQGMEQGLDRAQVLGKLDGSSKTLAL